MLITFLKKKKKKKRRKERKKKIKTLKLLLFAVTYTALVSVRLEMISWLPNTVSDISPALPYPSFMVYMGGLVLPATCLPSPSPFSPPIRLSSSPFVFLLPPPFLPSPSSPLPPPFSRLPPAPVHPGRVLYVYSGIVEWKSVSVGGSIMILIPGFLVRFQIFISSCSYRKS